MAKATNYDKPIPAAEDISEDLRNLLVREATLLAELTRLDEESSTIREEINKEMNRDPHRDAVDALLRGVEYEPPLAIRDKMSRIANRRRLVNDALHDISSLIREERSRASRLVASEFLPEQRECAAEFYLHIANAARAHVRFDTMRNRLERAGIETAVLHDFGRDLFGVACKRDDHAGYAFRDAVKRGYVKEKDVPGGYL